MTAKLAYPIEPVSGVVQISSAQDLVRVKEKEISAAIWHKPVNAKLLNWLNALPADQLPHARANLDCSELPEKLTQWVDEAGMPSGEMREMLLDDVVSNARDFAKMMEVDALTVRLERVSSNACRKFHVDAVKVRLVCTYRGTGTQYGTRTDDLDPVDIATLPTGWPVLLRGSKWPVEPATGLVHRSPPIEGTGETRLLLVLDVIDPNAAPGMMA